MMINKYSTPWQFRPVPGGYEIYMLKDGRRKPEGNTIIYDKYEDWGDASRAADVLNEARGRSYEDDVSEV